MAHKNQIAQAVHLGIGAQHVDRFLTSRVEKAVPTSVKHFFQDRGHVGEVANVLGIEAGADGLRAAGKAEQKVANALQADHELHAGQQLAGFGLGDLSDDLGHARVDFHVQVVEFFFAFAEGIENATGCGGNAFGGGCSGFLGDVTSFNGALHQVGVGRFRFGASQMAVLMRTSLPEATRRGRTDVV